MTYPFTSVLVANRGEIACRIIRTLRELGIRSIAVYSDADRDALHTRLADVAVRIGPAAAQHSYLDADAIIAAALAAGAQAIHPGYGFLSENADFARACEVAGIVFVGPSIAAIDIMGDKIRAKQHVSERGVPIIAGTGRAGESDADLIAAAAGVGYPLLIKPSAGGGGKGMTVVEAAADLPEALAGARRVALTAFGDDTLLLERYLSQPRHIEVQVLADAFGHVIHLGERECSLQRRHQKIIEESPSPLLTPEARARMGEAACEVARSVGYRGAGTVEFLVSASAPDEFFFMEMNTRLQVEHPVTEQVTGVDLVRLQLRIAAGEHLGIAQQDVTITGHSIEARLYAEDPARDFVPATGRVLELREASGDGIRIDSSLVKGLTVDTSYDPMLAKIIATGADRAEAIIRLDRALADTVVLGVRTNREFLRALLADPQVRAGDLDTGLIARFVDAIGHPGVTDEALIAAALLDHESGAGTGAWRGRGGWRVGEPRPARYSYRVASGDAVTVHVLGTSTDATVAIGDDVAAHVRLAGSGADRSLDYGDRILPFVTSLADSRRWIATTSSRSAATTDLVVLDRETLLAAHRSTLTRAAGTVSPEVRTPMPGTVVAVAAPTGTEVEAGQLLLTIEAMKMEHRMLSPISGVVTIDVGPGDQVSADQVVAHIAIRETEPHPQGAPA